MVAVGSPQVGLSVEKTIMKGNNFCNFRYKFTETNGSEV